jgi:hypothetical protein
VPMSLQPLVRLTSASASATPPFTFYLSVRRTGGSPPTNAIHWGIFPLSSLHTGTQHTVQTRKRDKKADCVGGKATVLQQVWLVRTVHMRLPAMVSVGYLRTSTARPCVCVIFFLLYCFMKCSLFSSQGLFCNRYLL